MTLPRFGLNYVPPKRWYFSWMDWHPADIAQDLQQIAALGMDHIRIHCLWPYFQPNPTYVSEAALDRLTQLLDRADEVNLDVCVTVLDGWLSGFSFYPAWKGKRNLFTDPQVIEAEKFLFARISERIGSHPRFLGFDLGNELGVLQQRDDPVTPDEADAWQAEMMPYLQQIAPGKFHVNGVDHIHWYRNIGFTRRALANAGSATVLHCWLKWTGMLDRYGPMGVGSLHLPEYMAELARAYQETPGERPIWLQEFGASALTMGDRVPDFAEAILRNTSACPDIWGITWWGSHEINPALTGFSPGEYPLGLLDVSGQVKPAGARIAAVIQDLRASPPVPAGRSTAVVFPEGAFCTHTAEPLWPYIDRFMELITEGAHPAIVLDSLAGDSAYLAQRGIRELVEVKAV